MDDEEYTYQALQEPLYRVETGNYEYRLVLRCRQEARKRFAALRSDVLVKLELLDQKHVHNIATQITQFISSLEKFNTNCHSLLSENCLFPIELDLSKSCLIQNTTTLTTEEEYHDDEEPENGMVEMAEEANNLIEETKPEMDELIEVFGNLATSTNSGPVKSDQNETLYSQLMESNNDDHSGNESTSPNSTDMLLF